MRPGVHPTEARMRAISLQTSTEKSEDRLINLLRTQLSKPNRQWPVKTRPSLRDTLPTRAPRDGSTDRPLSATFDQKLKTQAHRARPTSEGDHFTCVGRRSPSWCPYPWRCLFRCAWVSTFLCTHVCTCLVGVCQLLCQRCRGSEVVVVVKCRVLGVLQQEHVEVHRSEQKRWCTFGMVRCW